MSRLIRSDRGASVFMLAISLFLLIGASAVAVDIAAIWLDRSTSQKVTDAAAAAGVLQAMSSGGQSGCESALTYVVENTADLDSIDTSGCVLFSGTCTEGAAAEELKVEAGRYELTVVYPVPYDDDLMTSRIVGRHPQAFHEDDGDESCERVGVKMASTRSSLFAQVLGFNQGNTTVHTVAKRTDGDPRPPFNLLVLDRTGCPAIDVGGGGGIIADAVIAVDPDTGAHLGLVPGIIAADSDGSACSPSKGVINISGGGSLIRSDGAECPSPPWTLGNYPVGAFTAYTGCGQISVYAPGTPGCNWPACTFGGGGNAPIPPPTPLGDRYTRRVADHKYNCYADYTSPPTGPDVLWASPALTVANQQHIPPCEAADGTNDYIYELIQYVGQTGEPGSLPRWTDVVPGGCNPSADVTIPLPGVVVNCGTLQITTGVNVTINGNAVFNRNVSVNGSLTVNPPAGDPWVFFRNGRLSKAGSGRIAFNNAMVYMSKSADLKLTGGSGALIWTAPTSGRFEALALWSDSPQEHSWSGQANLTMDGIFFMPWALASYSGNGDMQQTNAQWIAWRVSASGNGALRIAPPVGNALTFPDHATILIR